MADYTFCAGCQRVDEDNQALLWCSDCIEPVCETCATVHRKLLPPHNVVSLEYFTNVSSSVLKISKNCNIHKDQKLLLFCCQHDLVICDKCFSQTHHGCKPIESVDEASKNAKHGTAVNDLEKRIENLSRVSENILDEFSKGLSNFEEERKEIKDVISNIRKKINLQLDQIEADLNKELDRKHKNRADVMVKAKADMQEKHNEVITWREDIKSLTSSASNLHVFLAIKVLDGQVHQREDFMKDIQNQFTIPKLKFEPISQIANDDKLIPLFGTISVAEGPLKINTTLNLEQQSQMPSANVSQLKIPLVFSLSVGKQGRFSDTWRGCLIFEDNLLLADKDAKCLLLAKLDGSKFYPIELAHKPHRVASYDKDICLVSLGNHGILVLDFKSISLDNIIRPGIDCRAIYSSNKQIWVRTSKSELKLIDIKGNVHKTLNTTFDPMDLYISSDGSIYSTDSGSDRVYIVSPEGKERLFYRDPGLLGARGITEDSKYIYVGGFSSRNIHRVSKDGMNRQIIIPEDDLQVSPTSIAYIASKRELVVISNDRNEEVKIYYFNY